MAPPKMLMSESLGAVNMDFADVIKLKSSDEIIQARPMYSQVSLRGRKAEVDLTTAECQSDAV